MGMMGRVLGIPAFGGTGNKAGAVGLLQGEQQGLAIDAATDQVYVRDLTTPGNNVLVGLGDWLTQASTSAKLVRDASGTYGWSGHNLALQSEDFSTTWANVNSTDTVNSVVAPNGTTTGDTVTDNSANNQHSIYQDASIIVVNQIFTISVYAKAGTRTVINLAIASLTDVFIAATFDLSAGTVSQSGVGSSGGVLAGSAISDEGNGWYRCSVSGSINNVTSVFFQASLADAATFSRDGWGRKLYIGDGSDLYLWGAMLNRGPTALPYIPTTTAAVYLPALHVHGGGTSNTENLVLQSETFNSWATKTNLTVSSDAIAAPDGNVTADKLVEASDTGQNHFIQSASVSVVSGEPHTAVVFAKAAGRSWINLRLYSGAGLNAFFDLTLGVTGTVSVGVTASIEDAGDGWYKCIATRTSAAATFFHIVQLAESDNDAEYNGDGSSGVYLWGAQLNRGSTATTYVATTTTAAPYQRVSGDIAGGTLRTENAFLQSEVLSTTWSRNNVTIVDNEISSPDGATTADKVVETSDTGNHNIIQSPVLVSGVVYTVSVYIRSDERRRCNFYEGSSTGAIAMFDATSGTVVGTSGGGSPSGAIEDAGGGWYRVSMSFTAGASAGANISLNLAEDDDTTLSSYAGDTAKGMHCWGFQLNEGTAATAYVATTAAAQDWVSAGSFPLESAPAHGRGLLVEPAGTNLLTQTRDLTSDWTETDMTSAYKAPGIDVTTVGAELSTNGGFDSDTGWTKNDGWTIDNGVATSAGGGSAVYQDLTGWAVSGDVYKVVFTVSNYSAGSIKSRVGNGDAGNSGTNRTANGTFTDYIQWSGGGGNFNILSDSSDFVGSIDNVSVKKVSGLATRLTSSAANATSRQDVTSGSAARIQSIFAKRRTGTGSVYLSQGETTGVELVTNGAFASDLTGWTLTKTASASIPDFNSGVMRMNADGSGFSRADQSFTTVAGKVYSVTFTIAGTAQGVKIGTGSGLSNVANYVNQPVATTQKFFQAAGTTTWIRLEDGAVSASSFDNITIQEVVETELTLTDEYQRFDTGSATITNPPVIIRIATSGDAIDVDVAQQETGAVATSPIPTVGASVTRAVDKLTKAGTAFPLSATEGTVFYEFVPMVVASSNMVWALGDGTNNNERMHSASDLNRQLYVIDGGVKQADLSPSGDPTVGQVSKVAATYKLNDFAASLDGSAVVTDGAGTIPVMNELTVGSERGGASGNANILIKTLVYVPRRMTDAELVAKTS